VVSLSALIAGSVGLLAAVDDGFYYREIHSKMIDCSGFVRNHIAEDPRYPTEEMMKDWSRDNNVSPSFYLGVPEANHSIRPLYGELHYSNPKGFHIGYWDGDNMEFFNSSDASFTTSMKEHSGKCALYGIAFLAIGFVSFRIRGYLEKARSEQAEDGKASPAIS